MDIAIEQEADLWMTVERVIGWFRDTFGEAGGG